MQRNDLPCPCKHRAYTVAALWKAGEHRIKSFITFVSVWLFLVNEASMDLSVKNTEVKNKHKIGICSVE